MKSLRLYQLLFARLLFLLMAVVCGLLALSGKLPYTATFCFLISLLLGTELFSFVRNTFLCYDKTINAILNNDFSADFSRFSSFENYKSLFRLYDHLKHRQNEQVSKDFVYQSILNSIETGILILQKGGDDWNIFLMNDYFSRHFTVPKVSRWKYLRNQLPALCGIIEGQNFGDIRTTVQIRINSQDSQTFMLQASKTKTSGQDYYIVFLDSIQKVIAKKEKEAWINLMKVISHELMNSITPIRSLSQNLDTLMQQESLSPEDIDDIRQSVATMAHRSNHLQGFVDSYRKLAMLPSPNKQKTELSQLVANTLDLMAPLFKNAGIVVQNAVSAKRWIMADVLQMEQVVINLLTNSMYALENHDRKQIGISVETKNNRVFIIVSDNGIGVEKEIESKIFLPFFTTRASGAGIGLTLSKNIIEAHGGYLNFQMDADVTKFVICLME